MFVHGEDDTPVIALVAGDRQCDADALAISVGSPAPCRRPDAARVKAATGYAIGGVSPIGLPDGLPVFIDSSLFRFPPSGPPPGIRTAFSGDAAAASGALRRDSQRGHRGRRLTPLEPPAPAPISIASNIHRKPGDSRPGKAA